VVEVLVLGLSAWLAGCGDDGGAGGLRGLAENYNAMSAAEVKEVEAGLSNDERVMLASYSAFAEGVYLKACQSDSSTIGYLSVGQYDCNGLASRAYNTASFVGEAGWAQNVESDRLRLVNALKCSSGESDPASCAAYVGASGAAGDLSGSNGQAIIDSMPNTCDPNTDLYCY